METDALRSAILALAGKKAMTIREMADAIGVSFARVSGLVQRMRRPKDGPKLVYVAGWRDACYSNGGGRPSMLLAAGDRPDVPPPKALTNAERKRRHRERMSPEQRDFERARDRARHWRPKRDNLTVALFGAYRGETTK